jgi:hypothetical protein
MERANDLIRKLFAIDEKSVVPVQDGGDRGSFKHLWAILLISFAIIIFGFVMAFTGLFER